VPAAFGAPAHLGDQLAEQVGPAVGWRCGWLRDGFVLSCSLAGPQGPVNEMSVARR